MNYTCQFYWECPDTYREHLIQVCFEVDQEPADRVEYWGRMIDLPATNEVNITSVSRNQKEWTNYPDSISEEIYNCDWIPETELIY